MSLLIDTAVYKWTCHCSLIQQSAVEMSLLSDTTDYR